MKKLALIFTLVFTLVVAGAVFGQTTDPITGTTFDFPSNVGSNGLTANTCVNYDGAFGGISGCFRYGAGTSGTINVGIACTANTVVSRVQNDGTLTPVSTLCIDGVLSFISDSGSQFDIVVTIGSPASTATSGAA